jgi:hypothetical protein
VTIRRADLRRVADLLRRAADGIEQRGDHAWTLTREWQTGPAASTLQTGRSRTLGDPTGRAAITRHPDPHAAMLHALDRAVGAAVELLQLYRDVGPDPRPCAWHHAAGRHATATRRAAGADVCDWCYRRHAATGRPPTRDQINARHNGADRIPRGTP